MKKRILVTGGAGFIGSNFVRYMLEKHPRYEVIVLDVLTYAGTMDNFPEKLRQNSNFAFWYGNIRNSQLVNELTSKVDIVVHLAAETHVARSIYDNTVFYETDVLGTQVVANAVLNHPNVERFVHVSSSEVYGTALNNPMTEEHPLNPLTPYASAKAGADRLVYSYWATYDIPAVILRPFNNYGPNQHLEKLIPRFITSAILNEPPTVHGDGKNSRDWIYVRDVCEAIDKVLQADLEKVKGEVINIGTGIDTDVITIANMILEKMGKPKSLITHIGDRPGQVRRHISSTDKAKRLLGWNAKTDLDTGLDETIKWYSENKDWWRRLLWMRSVPIKTKNGRIEYH